MKTTIETLNFPSDVEKKLKMKVSATNLSFQFIPGHIINLNKTNISVIEPHRIIVSNSKNTLLAILYDDCDKICLPNNNLIVSITKYIEILNAMNKN